MLTPNDLASLLVAFIALYVLGWLYAQLLESTKPKKLKAIIITVAFFNGLLLGTGLTPYIDIGREFISLSTLIPPAYLTLVTALVNFGTLIEVLLGLQALWETSEWYGVLSFVLAFFSGIFIVTRGFVGIGLILFTITWPVVAFSPAKRRIGGFR